jgi:protein TonB
VLIPESKVLPEYPEIARRARLTANVVLQAIVYKDGTVGEISVIRCNRPNIGFEESAIEAVRKWRYLAATLDSHPVDAYFTITVAFTLQ